VMVGGGGGGGGGGGLFVQQWEGREPVHDLRKVGSFFFGPVCAPSSLPISCVSYGLELHNLTNAKWD